MPSPKPSPPEYARIGRLNQPDFDGVRVQVLQRTEDRDGRDYVKVGILEGPHAGTTKVLRAGALKEEQTK